MIFLLALELGSNGDKLISIYDQYKRMILTIAYDILKDYHEAEDVLQNVIIKLSYHLDGISSVSSQKTKGFIIQITRNHCFDIYNSKKRIVLEAETIDSEAIYPDEPFHFETTVDNDTISDLTKELKKEYSEILTLTYYHELTVKEISILLNISESNVSVRLNRAHNALKRLMSERKKGEVDVNR